MKKWIIILMLLFSGTGNAHDSNEPPQLWSWFKDLNKSAEACKIQSLFTLEKLGIDNVVENQYGLYGTYQANRIVVKCLSQDKASIVWVAVAGHDRESVERLRNTIVKEIK